LGQHREKIWHLIFTNNNENILIAIFRIQGVVDRNHRDTALVLERILDNDPLVHEFFISLSPSEDSNVESGIIKPHSADGAIHASTNHENPCVIHTHPTLLAVKIDITFCLNKIPIPISSKILGGAAGISTTRKISQGPLTTS
jgi:hypothetical protein